MYLTLKKTSVSNAKTAYIFKVFFGSLCIALAAKVSIPFYPVPMTLEPDAVMLVGLLCSPALAMGITTTFVLEALLGFPVLHSPISGPHAVFGPTGGYIFGFILMASTISMLKRHLSTSGNNLWACIAGWGILFACGVAWLSHLIGFEKALETGLYPFLPKTALTIFFVLVAQRYINNGNFGKKN